MESNLHRTSEDVASLRAASPSVPCSAFWGDQWTGGWQAPECDQLTLFPSSFLFSPWGAAGMQLGKADLPSPPSCPEPCPGTVTGQAAAACRHHLTASWTSTVTSSSWGHVPFGGALKCSAQTDQFARHIGMLWVPRAGVRFHIHHQPPRHSEASASLWSPGRPSARGGGHFFMSYAMERTV